MDNLPEIHYPEEVQKLVKELIHSNPAQLALTLNHPQKTIISLQISSRQRIARKLPSFYHNFRIFLPPAENLAQSSSELTAAYKAEIWKGKLLVDLTYGFGVDSLQMRKSFEKVIGCEPNSELASISEYNQQILNAHNVEIHCQDAESFLNSFSGKADMIYADPSRRENGNRFLSLNDASPNIFSLIPLIFQKTNRLLIKASPMEDLTKLVKTIPYIHQMHILGVGNECREILLECRPQPVETERRICATYKDKKWNKLEFFEKPDPLPLASGFEKYIHEPIAAVMKGEGQDILAGKLSLSKADRLTHLYFSDQHITDPQLRTFEILERLRPKWKELKRRFSQQALHVISRNFPDNGSKISSRLNLIPGGNEFLIFFKLRGDYAVYRCKAC